MHNPKVTQSFEARGVHFVESFEDIKDPKAVIVFSAHGTDRNIINQAKQVYKAVYNLECPFVTKIYTEAESFIKKWITTFFYIGKEHHQEGKNVISYIRSKWAQVYVFQTIEEIPEIDKKTEIAVLSQTTLNFAYVQEILSEIQKRYPHAHIPASSDVCKATYERQSVILQHIDTFDTFIVIWGKESNNTRELYEIWLKHNKQTFYGESLADIRKQTENDLLAHEKVAVTGWASTPQEDIQEVVDFFVRNGYKEETLMLQ